MTNSKKKDQMEYLEIKETNREHDAKYLRAKERILEVKEFYSKFFRSVVTIIILAAINYYTNEWRYMWFLWAAFGIGISLAFKASKVFGLNPFLGKDWEERKIQEFMNEDKEQNRWN